nr:MAG TPA: hypothetical protein [Caudoviricetes sp.]
MGIFITWLNVLQRLKRKVAGMALLKKCTLVFKEHLEIRLLCCL